MPNGFLVAAAGTSLQFFSDQGVILAGGKVATYVGGTVSTPVVTYTTSALNVANANPIVLGSNGRLPSSIWVPSGTLVKMVLMDSSSNPVQNGTIDNLAGVNDVAALSGGGTVNFLRADGQWVPPIATAPTIQGPVTITAPGGGYALQVTGTAAANVMQLYGASQVFATSYAGDTYARGVSLAKYKVNQTSRNTTITPTVDPDLQGLALLANSAYKIELLIRPFCTTTTTQGIAFNLAYSGSFANASGTIFGQANSAAYTGPKLDWFAGTSFANIAISPGGDFFICTGHLVTSSAGNLSLQWSQKNSSANNTTLVVGDYLIATEVS